MKKIISIYALLLVVFFSGCKNDDWEYEDYEGGTTVYFATQYPVRKIVLGNDETYDISIDNEHKFIIYATMGGVYSNKTNRTVDIAVVNSLCDNLQFEDGGDIIPMPSNYYTLASNQIVIPKGKVMGGVEVQLTDAFFADPLALKNTYVIPLVMSNVQNADSILSGKPKVDNPSRVSASDWDVTPKDYVLYAVKYINPWDAVYLRRGVDIVTEGGQVSTIVRHEQYTEKDEVYTISTLALKKNKCTVSTQVEVWNEAEQKNNTSTLTCDLTLTFNDKNECTVTSASNGYTATGTGKFVEDGEKNSFNNKDRDVLYLDYTIDYAAKKYATKDTLVVRDRQIKGEWFNVINK